MSIGIYKIENLINGKIYIGQSVHIERRWKEHCNWSSDSLISRAIKEYGKENFSFEILESGVELSQLNSKESYYIRKFDSLIPKGYNVVYKDEQQHQCFIKYDSQIFFEIIDKIKYSNLSFKEIAELYSLDVSTIYSLNRGDSHWLPDTEYPLREVKTFNREGYFCADCGKKIVRGAKRCPQCDQFRQRKVERPPREELKNLIRLLPFTQIAEIYGVTDNAIRKWCKPLGLPFRKKDIKNLSDSEWEQI